MIVVSQVKTYNLIDIITLGVIAAVFAVVFTVMWTPYYAIKAVGGPIIARLLTYGAWFMAAPLAASLIRKPLSALIGEFLPALLESVLPTPGGLTNAIYGLAQGFFSELAYVAGRYRRFGLIEAAVSGALAAIPAVTLDAVLFGEIYPWGYMALILVIVAISGAVYGVLAYWVARALRA